MWPKGGTFKFWVKLGAYEPGVGHKLYDFYKASFRVQACSYQACLCKSVQVLLVELVTMAVAFCNRCSAIALGSIGAGHKLTALCSQTHSAPFL